MHFGDGGPELSKELEEIRGDASKWDIWTKHFERICR